MSNIEQQLEDIQKVLGRFPDGGLIEEIRGQLSFKIGLRTLQRRMSVLKEKELVTTTGEGKATRYHNTGLVTPPIPIDPEERSDLIPMGGDSREILDYVSQPIQGRTPVGYSRNFLEYYTPGKDFYLNKVERAKLLVTGQTGLPDQPAGTYAKEILHRLLIDLSWNSSRLEGNTYSLLDTERLIAMGQEADNKNAGEAQMILNHKDAIEFLVQSADDIGFNPYTIRNLHALLAHNLLGDPAAPGRIRRIAVGIKGSVYTPPGIPQIINEMFEVLLNKVTNIPDPFEQAFFIMVHLPYLQPFEDVNKRVSRLAVNISLNKHNLVPLSFTDVPADLYIKGLLGVYELNQTSLLKDVFIWAYERSAARYSALRQSLGEPDLFKLKYRQVIRETITKIITESMSSLRASTLIKIKAAELPNIEKAKFTEYVETELMALHEGNFARYMVTPAEFAKWKEAWLQK